MTDIVIVDERVQRHVLADTRNYTHITFGPEARAAELYTEITVGDKKYSFTAAGVRGCAISSLTLNSARTTLVYNLQCDLTYFHAANTELGPVTIIDDPRRAILGSILLRRNEQQAYELPGLSYFNQYLIFNVGQEFYYYPSPWQVVAAITAWPPEFHQYHHLEVDTPIYDFNTRQPNVARKGISTISILGKLTEAEEKKLRAAHAAQIKKVKAQPGYQVDPEDFLNTPPA